jgi:LacI family transcriptional regulator
VSAGADARLGRPARLQDVAREAGVHVSTVSRALNDAPGSTIRPETRERILASAARLRYRPHAIARGLKLASTGAIGLLVPTLRNPVWAEIVHGVVDRAWERGLVTLLAEDTGSDAAQQAYERLVSEGRIDGLVIASAASASPLLDRFVEDGIPCVFANRAQPGSRRNVVMDEGAAARIAAEHLAGLGHRSIVHVDGPDETDTAHRRSLGFARAAEALGVAAEMVHVPFDEASGREAVLAALDGERPPTAAVLSNFNQAIGALAALRARRVRVPQELSLLSYDDDPMLEYLDVQLTSVRMPLKELGVSAVDALCDQMSGGTPRDVMVGTAPVLVVRSSTGPPRR